MSDPVLEPYRADDASTGPPPSSGPRRPIVARWFVVGLVVLFVGGLAIGRWAIGDDSSTAAQRSPSSTTTPTKAADPAASVLSGLGVRQDDVVLPTKVQLLNNGNQVKGQVTLNLCNGTFASEARRTARLQVVVLDQAGDQLLSTEAVLYSNPAAAAQAFSELKSVATRCPNSPVASPAGEPTITTRLGTAPDGNWPQTSTVERLAYNVTVTDQSGQTQHFVAAYLRRGRALTGVYFYATTATQPATGGKTTIADIVTLFANRLVQLPASVVNASG